MTFQLAKINMSLGQLVSVARLLAQFNAGTKNFSGAFGRLALLKQSVRFILITRMT